MWFETDSWCLNNQAESSNYPKICTVCSFWAPNTYDFKRDLLINRDSKLQRLWKECEAEYFVSPVMAEKKENKGQVLVQRLMRQKTKDVQVVKQIHQFCVCLCRSKEVQIDWSLSNSVTYLSSSYGHIADKAN